jgi:hypothetical protein
MWQLKDLKSFATHLYASCTSQLGTKRGKEEESCICKGKLSGDIEVAYRNEGTYKALFIWLFVSCTL